MFGCGGAAVPNALPLPVPIPDAAIAIDAPPPHVLGAIGAACETDGNCASGACDTRFPEGYCTQSCGDCTCGELLTGARCLQSCTRDSDCRADEGYVCDPTYHGCAIPNTLAIVPRTCATPPPDPTPYELVDAPSSSVAIDPHDDDPALITDRQPLSYVYDNVLRIPIAGRALTPLRGARAALVQAGGRIHAVALEGSAFAGYGSADHRLDYTVATRGSFSPPQQINGRDEELPYFFASPAIAVTSTTTWIAYVRGGRDARWEVVVVSIQGKLIKRAVIGDGCSLHMMPALAVDRTGTLHVVYADAGGYDHATCVPGRCTVRGRLVDHPNALVPRDDARLVLSLDKQTLRIARQPVAAR